MRRRRYRRRRAINIGEQGYAVFAFFCLFFLLAACHKEEFLNVVFSQVYWKSANSEETEISPWELAFAMVDGTYGFYLKNPYPDKGSHTKYEGISGPTEQVVLQDESTKEFLKDHFGYDVENPKSLDKNPVTEEEVVLPEQNIKPEDTALETEAEVYVEPETVDNDTFQKQEQPIFTPNYADLEDFTYLKKHYYTVDPTTTITPERLNYQNLTTYDATLKQDNSKPQILIYHTHSQEAFLDSVPGDVATGIVGVGERLAELLRDEYGFHVIHHKGTYDVPNRDYAYSASAPAIEKILEENPSIEVIIDLHRDGVSSKTHLVKEVGGRQTARFMFFNGISYLNATGPIDYLENPYINQNLAFSFQMKMAADRYYPGFARNIYLKGLRYNMHYREKSLLIEVGAQTNTVKEAMNAAEPIAHILSVVLKGEI